MSAPPPSAPPASRGARCRRVACAGARLLLQGTGLLAVAVGATVVGLSTPQGKVVIDEAVRQAVLLPLAEGWGFDRPMVRWDSTGRLWIGRVVFRDPQGEPYLSVGRLDVQLDLSGWRERRLVLIDPRLDGVDVSLDADADGVLDIVRAFGGPRPVDPHEPPSEGWKGLPFELVVKGLSLRDGSYRMRKRVDPLRTTLQVAAVSATGDVRLPLREPRVEVTGAQVQGHLVVPGPAPVSLAGDVTWTGDGLIIRRTTVDLLASHLVVDGTIDALSGEGMTALHIDASPLDLPGLDTLVHANLHDRFTGVVDARGPLGGLALTAELRDAKGLVALREGSYVCLPRTTAEPDPCGGPAGEDPELRWMAVLDMEHVQLEDILPVVRGPLRLEGRLRAAGHGTRWPDGLSVDVAHWEGQELDAYGIPVHGLAGDIRLIGGQLLLDDLSLTGVAGTVHGGGVVDIPGGRVDLDLYGPLDLSLLRDFGVQDIDGGGRYTGRVQVDWKRPGVPVDVDGEIWVEHLQYTEGVHIDRAHGRYHASVLRGVTEVEVDVDAHGVHPYGADADLVLVPDLHVHVSDQIVVGGTARSPELRYGDIVKTHDLVAPFVFDRPRKGGVPHVVAHAAVGQTLLRDLVSNHGKVEVELTDDQIELGVDLRYDADPFLVSPDMHVDLSTLTISAGELVFGPTAHQTWYNDRPLRLRVVDGGLADADIALGSHLGTLDLTGDVSSSGRLDGLLVLEDFDLGALADLAPDLASDLSGVVDGTLSFDGEARSPRLVLDGLHAEDLFLPGLARWMDVDGRVETLPGAGHDMLRVDLVAGVDGQGLLELRGDMPVRADLSAMGLTDRGRVDVGLTVLGGDLGRFELLMPDTDLPDGRVSATLRLGGAMRDPDIDLRGVVEVDVPGLAVPARTELDLQRRQGQLETHVDVYEGLHPIALADGSATTRLSEVMTWLLVDGPKPAFEDPSLFADNLDIDLHLLDVDVATLQAVAGTSLDVTGALHGRVSVDGSPVAPNLRTKLELSAVAGGLPLMADVVVGPGAVRGPARAQTGELLCPATTEERPYEARLRVAQVLGDEVPWVDVCGAMPLRIRTTEAASTWGAGTMDLAVGGAGVPLRLLSMLDPGFSVEQPDAVARRRGEEEGEAPPSNDLHISGHIGGSFAEIQPDLRFSTDGASFTYHPMGLTLRAVDIEGGIGPNPEDAGSLLLRLDRFGAASAPAGVSFQGLPIGVPSRLSAEGTMVLDEWAPGATEGTLTLSQAWVLGTDDQQLRASGRLRATGTWPRLAVRADDGVTIDQGFFSFDVNNLLESRESRLDPVIVVHRGETFGTDALAEEAGVLDDLDIQFRLDLGLNTSAHVVMPVLDDLGAIGAQVTRADVTSRIGGQLDVHLDRGQPDIGGTLLLRDGEFVLLRADFALDDDSQVTFLGADYANPRLDIHGVMDVTGGNVEVQVGGTASQPTVDFSSEAFGEDGALFTVFTGQPPEDFSSQQAQAAVEALSDLLLNSVLGGLNLGSVSVEADGTVTMGIPVYRTIYVESLFKPVPKLNEDRVTVIAEWSILPKLLLTAAYGDRHIWGNLFWEVRF